MAADKDANAIHMPGTIAISTQCWCGQKGERVQDSLLGSHAGVERTVITKHCSIRIRQYSNGSSTARQTVIGLRVTWAVLVAKRERTVRRTKRIDSHGQVDFPELLSCILNRAESIRQLQHNLAPTHLGRCTVPKVVSKSHDVFTQSRL